MAIPINTVTCLSGTLLYTLCTCLCTTSYLSNSTPEKVKAPACLLCSCRGRRVAVPLALVFGSHPFRPRVSRSSTCEGKGLVSLGSDTEIDLFNLLPRWHILYGFAKKPWSCFTSVRFVHMLACVGTHNVVFAIPRVEIPVMNFSCSLSFSLCCMTTHPVITLILVPAVRTPLPNIRFAVSCHIKLRTKRKSSFGTCFHKPQQFETASEHLLPLCRHLSAEIVPFRFLTQVSLASIPMLMTLGSAMPSRLKPLRQFNSWHDKCGHAHAQSER